MRVAIVRYATVDLPSDFGGHIHIAGSSHFTHNGIVQPGRKSKTDFVTWIKAMKFGDDPLILFRKANGSR